LAAGNLTYYSKIAKSDSFSKNFLQNCTFVKTGKMAGTRESIEIATAGLIERYRIRLACVKENFATLFTILDRLHISAAST
jgi:hypothetical protein